MEPGLGIIAAVPWQQVHANGREDRGARTKPLPWLKTWVSDEGDLMIDRSVDIPPLQYLRI